MISVILFAVLIVWIMADHLKAMKELRQLRETANGR